MVRPLRILNVAEKPSVAKEISAILSNRSARFSQTCARYNGLFQFQCSFNGGTHEMSFTSVLGHLMELDFSSAYRSWRSCRPIDLFNAPVEKQVPQDKQALKRNLETLARRADWLVLWLDCDREGENIAFEVRSVCLAANPRLTVKRARFSALTPQDLRRAVENLTEPDELASVAVDARQEIDLRIGASFTRFQTLLLQNKFAWNDYAPANGQAQLLSYGPCQFPTLGLIVQRAWDIQAHQAEPFWLLHLLYRPQGGGAREFTWDRGHLFDRSVAGLLYEACRDDPETVVTEVSGRERQRQPPPPLSTLEMQKKATGSLRLSGERIMKLAEELYQTGFISYPRTETDCFDPSYDLLGLVQQHCEDPRWGAHAAAIVSGAMWKPPANGGHDDRAHPPIHPTKHSTGEPGWCADKRKLYEFVARSFLATCSKAAVGRETRIEVSRGGEGFHATGLVVEQQNWLAVYPYTRWGGNANLPHVAVGQRLAPVQLTLQEAPSYRPNIPALPRCPASDIK